jgi:hypothetical protein
MKTFAHVRKSIISRDAEEVWKLCANEDVYQKAQTSPREMIEEIISIVDQCDEEMLTAVGTCLLEHMLEVDFLYIFDKIETSIDAGCLAMASCFSVCSKFGQSNEPQNSINFDRLKEKIQRA